MNRVRPRHLRVNAMRLEQRPGVPLFVFGVDGRLIHQFAAVEFAARNQEGLLIGFQRERVERHIREIHSYLSQDKALLPNAIVLALDGSVEFRPYRGLLLSEWGTLGQLEIALPMPGDTKPALIVDGQQRVSALATLPADRPFPVVVVAFSSSSEELQREQFVLVNKTKPLPRDLLNELLSHVETELPRPWRLRRVAAQVLELLRYDKASPFYGRIRGLGAQGEGANISQAAVLGVVAGSIRRGGLLSGFYSAGEDVADVVRMAEAVKVYFLGVERTWPIAWSGSPWTSRLVHGVGIHAMGLLMEEVMSEVNPTSRRAVHSVERRMRRLKRKCAWTEGRWPRLRREWNDLQNTSQDKRALSQYLLEQYRTH
jgi:DGQHR domain-containing protein